MTQKLENDKILTKIGLAEILVQMRKSSVKIISQKNSRKNQKTAKVDRFCENIAKIVNRSWNGQISFLLQF